MQQDLLPEEEIQVDFEFFDLVSDDDYPIQTLLKNYLENQIWNLRELSKLLSLQDDIGTAIKVDDNVFGFISVVDMHEHKNLKCIQHIKDYILKLGPNERLVKKLQNLFTDTNTGLGLIVNERVANVPPQLAPHLHTSFFEELKDAQKTNAKYNFDNYIFISTIHNAGVGEITSTPQNKKTKTGEETYYLKPEEEIYCKNATFYFTAPLKFVNRGTRWTFGGMMNESRLVCVVNKSKIDTILQEITKFCA